LGGRYLIQTRLDQTKMEWLMLNATQLNWNFKEVLKSAIWVYLKKKLSEMTWC
jgi:hypothetical protein